MNRKVEIIDDKIRNQYRIDTYTFSKRNWWGKLIGWKFESGLVLGKKYICPEIYQKKLTIEQYFDREVGYALEDDNIVEVHRIVIQNK